MTKRERAPSVSFLPERRVCKLEGCEVRFKVPKSAENKAFCCAEHRYEWHARQRAKALELLEAVGAGGLK